MKVRIVSDKIEIPHENPRISREHLLGMLGESLDCCTSTIVAARTGMGKTLLAKDFARRCGRRVAWYKVDASDGELRIFFRYLVESVRRQRPGFWQGIPADLAESPGLEDIPALAEAFLYELQECRGEPLLIVLDDLHLIYDAEWVAPFFRRLLPLLPAEAHVLIIGRSMPPAPLWRMRSKQTLCLVEEDELIFTAEEVKRLFAAYGLARADARQALEQSRGRASVLDAMARRMSGAAAAESFGVGKRLACPAA